MVIHSQGLALIIEGEETHRIHNAWNNKISEELKKRNLGLTYKGANSSVAVAKAKRQLGSSMYYTGLELYRHGKPAGVLFLGNIRYLKAE